MKDQRLMSLLFADAADFRDELLATTLRRIRRRRRVRRWGQTLVITAVFAMALWWSVPRRTVSVAPLAASRPSLQIIHTQPLSAESIVTSSQGALSVVGTDKATLAFVGDEELLDLVPGETKLLVWHAPHDAELVVIGP